LLILTIRVLNFMRFVNRKKGVMMTKTNRSRCRLIVFTALWLAFNCAMPSAHSAPVPFAPGERLTFELRWENIPAGSAQLEVLPIKDINGQAVYHFVMTARSNSFVDLFYKVRDRIDAFADMEMTRSVYYAKKQNGHRNKHEIVEFDWNEGQAHYSTPEDENQPIDLMPGSFDPLSAFYYTRMALLNGARILERPVTDGKKNVIGRARIVAREKITLSNGASFDTYCLEPELKHVGGVFEKSKDAKIQVWVTADKHHIPVQIKSKVAIGHFVGELVSAEGVPPELE
jgi:hypothetical protein